MLKHKFYRNASFYTSMHFTQTMKYDLFMNNKILTAHNKNIAHLFSGINQETVKVYCFWKRKKNCFPFLNTNNSQIVVNENISNHLNATCIWDV